MGDNTDLNMGRVVEVDRESYEGTVENDEVEPHIIVEIMNKALIACIC